MRSLLVIEDFPPCVGGIQTILYNICKSYPVSEMFVLTQRCEGYEDFDRSQNFKIYRRKFYLGKMPGKWKLLSLVLSIIYIIIKERINIIHFATPLPLGKLGVFFKKVFNKPYIVYTFGLDVLGHLKNQDSKLALKQVLSCAGIIVTISEFTKGKIVELGIQNSKVVKVNMGVDTERFHKTEANTEVVKRYNLKDKKVILTVGRLVERKGFDMVIRALPKVLERIPNAVYLILGEGEYKLQLEQLVRELRVNEKVVFVGEVPHNETPPFYNTCDVFIMPSRHIESTGDVEGFGMVYIEASACGKPVIGGRSGGIGDAVRDGVTGLLVDPMDSEKIAEALIKVLSDKDFASKLGGEGILMVKEEMRWEKCVGQIRNAVSRIVN